MIAPQHALLRGFGVVASLAAFCMIGLGLGAQYLPLAVIALTCLGMLVVLARPEPIESAAMRMGWAVAGPLYMGALFGAVVLLFRHPHGGSWVMLALLCGFLSDTARLLRRPLMGKRKLAPTRFAEEDGRGRDRRARRRLVRRGARALLVLARARVAECDCVVAARDGVRSGRRPVRVADQAQRRGEGQRHDAARARRHPRPQRCDAVQRRRDLGLRVAVRADRQRDARLEPAMARASRAAISAAVMRASHTRALCAHDAKHVLRGLVLPGALIAELIASASTNPSQ